jgi:surface protein
MSVYLGKNKVGVTIEKEKPDMLQARVDETNSCDYLFYNYQGEKVNVKGLDTSNVTSMYYMFQGCNILKTLDLSNFDTSNVTNMRNMFSECPNLTSIDLSSFNTKNVKLIDNMFNKCSKLTSLDLSNFNTEKVTNMSSMFNNCKALTSLNVSNFDTSKVTNMKYMFGNCTKLTELDVSNFDTSSVTDMSYMFSGCGKLTMIDLSSFDTSNVTNMEQMFYNDSLLENIVGTIDLIKATTAYVFLNGCRALKNIYLKNIKISVQLGSGTSYGTLLTNDSLINTFKELWDLTGSTSKTLTLSTTSKENIANIYVKLVDVTDEMLAQDQYAGNKKPCVVCESTDEGAMTLTEYAISKNWAIA